MNNNGNFINISDPLIMHNQCPSLMKQSYIDQTTQYDQSQNLISNPLLFHDPKSLMQLPKSEKRKQENLICDTCGIEVNSQQMMDAHIRGQKHMKKIKLKTIELANHTSDNIDINQKPVVLSNFESQQNQPSTSSNKKSALQLINELANFNKVTTKYDLIKETGPAHCKQFEVQLTIANEIYTGIGTSIKRAQQVAAEQALINTILKKPEQKQRKLNSSQMIPTREMNSNNSQQQINLINENKFEILLNKKHIEITEYDSTIIALNNFVEDTQRAMKYVSDQMMEQYQLKNIRVVPQLLDSIQLNDIKQIDENSSESFRMLKGVMKISILAMRLYLKTDHEYTLVLICANKPNVTLLNDICRELNITLNKQIISSNEFDSTKQQQQSIRNIYQVQAHIVDGCLTVKSSHLPQHTIRIILTSPVFHSEDFLNHDEKTNEKQVELNPDPTDMLDKNKCLQAAAEIRHSNWFTGCMFNHNYNIIVLRLLRHLQYNNQTPLSYLNLWCLVLLVHKCQTQPINSITKLFCSVFTYLSSGILLPNKLGLGIIDPCEKDPIDVANYLTNEQRSIITTYAQNIERLITFEQFDKIFPLNQQTD
ncbi:unnamed protein product [Rotaria sordida]|uniref:Uncharacterized protein n=1 Tax=Rotaria sordida TaxID=392033 RepID=A0A815RV47_9BILA|nr:unnamed protein product [Rotaria sordida]